MSGAFAAAPWLLLTLFLLALTAPSAIRRLGPDFLAVPAALFAVLAGLIIAAIPAISQGRVLTARVAWIPALGLNVDLRLDALATVMCAVIAVLGAAVLTFSVRYFPPGDDGLPKYAGSLIAFAAAMFALVLADNLLLLVVCWELTGILSYLLIAHRVRKITSRRAATQALMVTTAGGLTLLVGAVLLGTTAHTWTLSQIIADPPSGAAATAAVVLLIAGGVSKSAIVPFHFWLPGAMAAPTPASAYLHAATMVKAGIYLFARLAPAFGTLTLWRPTLLTLGIVTMVTAGVLALRQHDLKLLLAYGTVSQLGLMTALTGFGTPAAVAAALAILVAHAAFKGALFFVVGIVDTATGSRDLAHLSGVGRSLPAVAVLAVLASISMAGLPPMIGFAAKEAGYAALTGAGGLATLTAVAIAAGSALTVAYTTRFCWGAFARKPGRADSVATAPSPWMTAPTAMLVAVGLGLGLAPGGLDRLIAAHGAGAGERGALAVWHGWGLPLALTVAGTVAGLAAFAVQRSGERRRGQLAGPGREPGAAYRAVTAGVDAAAAHVTAATQRGSLPVSLGAIVLVLVALPGTVLIASGMSPGRIVVTAAPAQAALAIVVAALAVAAMRARRAIAAVLIVGGAGYAIAVLYVLRGAPDLALTQVLVESVTLIAAVLVILRMPDTVLWSPPTGRLAQGVRATLAAAAGALMTALALLIPGQRHADPVVAGNLHAIAERGGGHNVVNVILVDVRGWDTFGEVSVLIAAAIGVSSLVFLRNPHTSPQRGLVLEPAKGGVDRSSPWLASANVGRHSLLLEVATRLAFHLIVMFSLYVLFVGHNEPGGGFAAGLIAGIALTLRYLAGGRRELGEAAPFDAGVVMGLGMIVAAASATAGLATGHAAMTSWSWSMSLPGLGTIDVVTSTVFDIGVYLVVVGVVLEVLRSLGAELDRQAAPAAARPPRRVRRRAS
jgi:multicomponent Na+:H+ antiporter subunit A